MVEDDEQLYRRVIPGHFKTVDGKVRFGSQAFADRSKQPSVDRAKLCDFNPAVTQKSPANGVVCVVASSVRGIDPIPQKVEAAKVVMCSADVIEAPLRATLTAAANSAHALIVTIPSIESGSAFKRLLEALSALADKAGWTLPPA